MKKLHVNRLKLSLNRLLKYFRFFLLPISLIYFVISGLRNFLYDKKILKSYLLPMKSICIGNLSMGGTGKSPTTLFLLEKYLPNYKIHTLSRGYGRKTKGYIKVSGKSNSKDVGDEPLMFFNRFRESKNLGVHVCESRKEGIKQILKYSKPDLIFLDDAFQHRKVKAGFNILMTDYSKLFCEDFILPFGTLRESRIGKNRADLIIVSKSPCNSREDQKNAIKKKLNFNSDSIFFSWIKYEELISFSQTKIDQINNILLITGIANPSPLFEVLKQKYFVELIKFPDHHNFSKEDIQRIYKKFDTFANGSKAIVTSEKDFARLVAPEFHSLINEKPWYFQKISIQLDREDKFLEKIDTYLEL